MSTVVETQALCKHFGPIRAVRNLGYRLLPAT